MVAFFVAVANPPVDSSVLHFLLSSKSLTGSSKTTKNGKPVKKKKEKLDQEEKRIRKLEDNEEELRWTKLNRQKKAEEKATSEEEKAKSEQKKAKSEQKKAKSEQKKAKSGPQEKGTSEKAPPGDRESGVWESYDSRIEESEIAAAALFEASMLDIDLKVRSLVERRGCRGSDFD